MGRGVINSSPLPLVYHKMIVEHLIGEVAGGVGRLVVPLCHWYIISE